MRSCRYFFNTVLWSNQLSDIRVKRLENAIKELRHAALIKRNDDELSIHRLIQQAFLYTGSEAVRQGYFDAAVRIVEFAFPHQINGIWLHDRWEECRVLIKHGMSLANHFSQAKAMHMPLASSPEFGELLKNCCWFVALLHDV
jgi:hypothetical protein